MIQCQYKAGYFKTWTARTADIVTTNTTAGNAPSRGTLCSSISAIFDGFLGTTASKNKTAVLLKCRDPAWSPRSSISLRNASSSSFISGQPYDIINLTLLFFAFLRDCCLLVPGGRKARRAGHLRSFLDPGFVPSPKMTLEKPSVSFVDSGNHRLYSPFRAIGSICDDLPVCVEKRGDGFFITASIGKSFHIYDVESLNLCFAGN